jgi:5-methyltetrahydrofolate corrinoid/iron sulfur protein methyltransferase
VILIGEKINGTRKAVRQAIQDRDGATIARLAQEQTEAGSTYLDVNAGTPPGQEPEDMAWLVENVQAASDLPLCLDSANPEALAAGLALVKRTPMINSVSGERARVENVLPLAIEHKTSLILMALDDRTGIPATSGERLEIIHRLVGLALDGGLTQDQLLVDPLVTTISTGTENAKITLATIKETKAAYPEIHITSGLSNISFGMPLRSVINHTFLAMCIAAGMDSAIADPGNRDFMTTMLAAEMLMGQDRYCLNFNKAFRAGRIGPRKT